ncbi:DUF1707 SHOCT-like domain-containing protein [Enemella sp. A6]|uniref:DUF1707 SHOCT-like domain-containing protein n=1 Tax=Enemella sp. A6 TaxID=3440152 RepID=UPI003EBD437D
MPERRMRAGDADRDAVLEVLQTAYAEGRLTIEEYSERQDAVLQTSYLDELTTLIDDLPEQESFTAQSLAPREAPVPVVPDEPARWHAAVMSGSTVELERGSEGMNSVAFWGGDDIYLTDAMGPGVTITLNLHTVMAGNDIYVPEGVRVIDKPIAIMGGNSIKKDARGDGSNGTLILRGLAFWGGNEVHLDKRQDKSRKQIEG